MINFDPNVNSILPNATRATPQAENPGVTNTGFSEAVKAVGKCVSKIDDIQQASDASVDGQEQRHHSGRFRRRQSGYELQSPHRCQKQAH
jgi:hypothetical protein